MKTLELNSCSKDFFHQISVLNRSGEISQKCKIAIKVIEFALPYLNNTLTNPARIHSHDFGKISKNFNRPEQVFQYWLKSNVFREAEGGHYIVGKQSKGYVINQNFLLELIGATNYSYSSDLNEILINFLKNKYKSELELKQPFQYTDSNCGRINHPLINQSSLAIKPIIFSDWHDFDISTAAPVILYQLYKTLSPISLPHIEEYINNKSHIRELISSEINLINPSEKKKVKIAINALFNNASLSITPYNSLYKKTFGKDVADMLAFKTHPWICALIKEIKEMWTSLKSIVPTNKKDWNLYLQEEKKIRDVFIEYLSQLTGEKHLGFFIEHDGFRIHKNYMHLFNKKELLEKILKSTNYSIDI